MKYNLRSFKIIFSHISKKIFIKLLILIIATSLLETLGVAIIVPIFKFIFSNNIKSIFFFNKINNINIARIIIVILFVFFFLLKNTLSYFILNKQLLSIFSLQETLSNKLFKNYIYRDYLVHTKSDSAILTRNILSETNTLSNTLIQMLYLLSEFLTLVFILILLLLYQPVYTFIIIAFVSSSVILFYKYFSKKTKLIGNERQKYDAKKIKNIQISLNSLKEIKISSSENYFINKFINANNMSSLNAKTQNLYQQIPKLYLEVVIIFAFSMLSILFILQNKSLSDVVLILSFFGAAVFRLLPSLNRLIVAVQSIQIGYPSFILLSKELDNFSAFQENSSVNILPKINVFQYIEISNLTFSYDKDDKFILKDLNLKILKGSFIAIIGESGKGKSTFVNILSGLIRPQKMLCKIDDQIIEIYNNKEWKKIVGYVPQKINIIDGSIAENIAFGIEKEFINYDIINNVIKMSGLSKFIYELKLGYDHQIGDYGGLASGGQLQRLAIARALYNEPQILILDEATSSLDSKIESEILSNLREMRNNLTIIMITHKKENLNFCDYVFSLENLNLKQL